MKNIINNLIAVNPWKGLLGVMILVIISPAAFALSLAYTSPISGTNSYEGGTASGTYGVWYGCDHSSIIKPIILLEGFDPLDQTGHTGIKNQVGSTLANALSEEGYDLITLNYNKGGTYIQRNAYLAVALINEINSILQTNNSDHELVVIGMSMGGLVGRYALTYMEDQSMDHNTRLFLTYDTPHKGANFPLGIQHAIDFMISYPNNPLLSPLLDPVADFFIDKALVFKAVAAKQMLFYYYQGTTLDDDLQAELNNLGWYPDDLRKVAVANGAGDGLDQPGLVDRGKLFGWEYDNWNLIFEGDAYAIPGEPDDDYIFEGAWKTCVTIVPFVWRTCVTPYSSKKKGTGKIHIDNAPGGKVPPSFDIIGGLVDWINSIPGILGSTTSATSDPDFTFVPTASALGLNTSDYNYRPFSLSCFPYTHNESITEFDAIYADNLNTYHLESTPYIRNRIMEEISPQDIYLQNAIVASGTKIIEARHTITSGTDIDPVSCRQNTGGYEVSGSGEVIFRAGDAITLKDGFRAKSGSEFRAYIQAFSCSAVNINKQEEEPYPVTSATDEAVDESDGLPETFSPNRNWLKVYPNPFTHTTTIEYALEQASTVTIVMHNIHGQEIARPVHDLYREAGIYQVDFQAEELPKGMYTCRLTTDHYQQTIKINRIQ